jgi:hypothetical protein
MKKRCFLSLLFSLVVFACIAQKDYYTLNPGEKYVDGIPDTAIYYSPQFIKGYVKLKDGRSGALVLNYNYLYEEMIFINDHKDTVAVISPQDFNFFVLGKDTFYFDKVYLRNIASFGEVYLAERDYFGVADVKKEGPLSTSTSVGIEVIRRTEATDNSGVRELVAKEVMTIKKYRQYFIGNDRKGFAIATKKSVLKMYPDKSAFIKSYLTGNNINFNNPDDLVKLLKACQ